MTRPLLVAGLVLAAVGMIFVLPTKTHTSQVMPGSVQSSSDAGPSTPVVANPVTMAAARPETEATSQTVAPRTTATELRTVTSDPTPNTEAERVTGVGEPAGQQLTIELAFRSEVDDVTTEELAAFSLTILNDGRGWGQAGFRFASNPESELQVVLAEGQRVDELCRPLRTGGSLSCQNGAVVALNATRWREATTSWDATVEDYRSYLVNHEVGHLIGQRHPTPRCPTVGAPAGVMEQQTKGLEGCIGNAWPRSWELAYAAVRPAKIGPVPAWAPDPVPANLEGSDP